MDPYLPYEYTCEGMLERIHAYIQHQVCGSPTLGLWGGAAPESEDPPLPGVQGALAPPRLSPACFLPCGGWRWTVEGPAVLLRDQAWSAPLLDPQLSHPSLHIIARKCKISYFSFYYKAA